ncbi:hypothetical protein [Thermostichus sp. MS-CIW-28]
MSDKKLDIWVKFLLIGAEVLFVSILALMRLSIAGWLFLIFPILLILLIWIGFHIVLMTAFILSLRSSIIDWVIYGAVHWFYMLAWLFQNDGDDVRIRWVIQLLPFTGGLEPFLNKWGGTLFLIMAAATFICYVIIFILLIVRIVRAISGVSQ